MYMNFLKRNLDLLIILLISVFIILINFDFSKLVIGLDNASPYFNILDVLARIKGTSSVIYGGILFQAPFIYPLRLIGIAPEVVSNLYLSTNLILGTLGITLLSRRITKNMIASTFASVVLISSLFTFWIFSSPNFLFLASFGSIPLLIYFLSKEKITKKDILAIMFLSLIFLTTTLNIVAFLIYISQIVLLTLILSKKNNGIKRVLIWSGVLLLTWLSAIQITMIVNGDTSLFVIQILNYVSDLLSNPYMEDVTRDILASEKTNSFVDVAKFSTGWMELHDTRNIPIFTFFDTYKNSILFTLLGILPFLLSLLTIYFEKSKKVIYLTFLLLFFLIISSKVGVSIIENIPYIKDALRWPSSKLWPIYIFPLTILSSISVTYILKLKKIYSYILIAFLFVSLTIYSFPVLSGNLISPKTQVNIPNEYFNIPKDSNILILPEPQKLYMREYEWGYYGSDFISYINNSEIVDGANLYEYSKEYESILESGDIPNDIEYILYDMSAEINLDMQSLEKSRGLSVGYTEIISNEYFKIYERE